MKGRGASARLRKTWREGAKTSRKKLYAFAAWCEVIIRLLMIAAKDDDV